MKKQTSEKMNLRKNKPMKTKTYKNKNLCVAFSSLTTYATPELDLIVGSPSWKSIHMYHLYHDNSLLTHPIAWWFVVRWPEHFLALSEFYFSFRISVSKLGTRTIAAAPQLNISLIFKMMNIKYDDTLKLNSAQILNI